MARVLEILEEVGRGQRVLVLGDGMVGAEQALGRHAKSIFAIGWESMTLDEFEGFDLCFLKGVEDYDLMKSIFLHLPFQLLLIYDCFLPELTRALDHAKLRLACKWPGEPNLRGYVK